MTENKFDPTNNLREEAPTTEKPKVEEESKVEEIKEEELEVLVVVDGEVVDFPDVELKVKIQNGEVVEVLADLERDDIIGYGKEDIFAFLKPFVQIGIRIDENINYEIDDRSEESWVYIKKDEINVAIKNKKIVIEKHEADKDDKDDYDRFEMKFNVLSDK
jgi:hypothetical protein